MRLYHPKYRDRKGRMVESRKVAAQFRDHTGHVRRLSLHRSKKSSQAAAVAIDRLVQLRVGGQPPDQAVNAWLVDAPPRIVERLGAWGILDEVRVQTGKPLAQHLEDWRDALAAKGCTAKHVSVSHQRALDVFTGCSFKTLTAIKPDPVRRFISEQLGTGPRSKNYYTAASKAFTKWCVREGRMPADPLACLQPIGGKALVKDVRRKRRALSLEECGALLSKTAKAPFRWAMAGPERSLLYRLALETGLRAGELHGLTAGSFKLDMPATVRVEAHETKNADPAVLPLKEETAARLKAHLADKLPTARAFNMPPSYDTAEMIRQDFGAAGITEDTPAGRVDFHALRHTFITNLARSGVHPKVAQDLARHSDINLTLSRYSHTVLEERSEAVGKLPDLDAASQGEGAQAVKEGTNDAPVDPDPEPPTGGPKGSRKGESAEQKGAQKAKTATAVSLSDYIKSGSANSRKVLNPLRLPIPPLRHATFIEEDSPAESIDQGLNEPHKGAKRAKTKAVRELEELNTLWPSLPAAVRAGLLATARGVAKRGKKQS